MPEALEGTVLVVDDDPHTRAVLMQLVTDVGCQVRAAGDGAECLQVVGATPPDLILLDVQMPGVDGFACCQALKSNPTTRLIPVVLVTGLDSVEDRVRGIEAGADDFLSKPAHRAELLARIRSLLKVKRLNESLESAENVIFALARAIEAKDHCTHGHTERVTAYALALGRTLGVSAPEMTGLKQGGILHDVGKIAVPEHILNKPGKLTPEEFAVVRQHPQVGFEICQPLHSLAQALPCIRWHHERPNGLGYPDGLRGGDIPRVARIVAIADTFDALISTRPYKEPMPAEAAFQILRQMGAGGHYDGEMVEAFVSRAATGFDPEYGSTWTQVLDRLPGRADTQTTKVPGGASSTSRTLRPSSSSETGF